MCKRGMLNNPRPSESHRKRCSLDQGCACRDCAVSRCGHTLSLLPPIGRTSREVAGKEAWKCGCQTRGPHRAGQSPGGQAPCTPSRPPLTFPSATSLLTVGPQTRFFGDRGSQVLVVNSPKPACASPSSLSSFLTFVVWVMYVFPIVHFKGRKR